MIGNLVLAAIAFGVMYAATRSGTPSFRQNLPFPSQPWTFAQLTDILYKMQQQLVALGYPIPPAAIGTVGPETYAAMERFAADHHLPHWTQAQDPHKERIIQAINEAYVASGRT